MICIYRYINIYSEIITVIESTGAMGIYHEGLTHIYIYLYGCLNRFIVWRWMYDLYMYIHGFMYSEIITVIDSTGAMGIYHEGIIYVCICI
jgi:hypothetical protein